jgi:4-oxalocrotonate tautomerase
LSIRRAIVTRAPRAAQCSGVDLRDPPDSPPARRTEHVARQLLPATKENDVPLIQVTIIEGVFTAPQKREIVECLTDALVAVAGESMRQLTWCIVEEVAGGEWGIGGHTLVADDVRALARSGDPT